MPTLFFVTEGRFIKIKGEFYSTGGFPYSLWQRYLSVFDEVCIVARVNEDNTQIKDGLLLSSGPRVRFCEIPYYIGPGQYLRKRRQIKRTIDSITDNNGIFLCRVPGNIGSLVVRSLRKKNKEYACEVVGDPWDVCAPGTLKTPIRPFLRIDSTLRLKHIVKRSYSTLYVTEGTLQKRYKPRAGSFYTSASNVYLPDSFFCEGIRDLKDNAEYSIVSVGSLAQMYKSPDVVLNAIKGVLLRGLKVHLTWVGDGIFTSAMKDLSSELGIQEHVSFVGSIPPEEVKMYLEKADLFVLASRTEGLPRAMIEAMACALPCIGTRVGGIPELLDDQVLVRKNNVKELSEKIISILTDATFYSNQSEKNLNKALLFADSVLSKRRKKFYENLLTIKY